MASEPSQTRARGGRLDGWKAIADYVDRSERAVQRWAAQRGFPVHRIGGSGSVFAWTEEVDEWFSSQASTGDHEPTNHQPPTSPEQTETIPAVPSDAAPSPRPPALPPTQADAPQTPESGAAASTRTSAPLIVQMPWSQLVATMVGGGLLGTLLTVSLLYLTGVLPAGTPAPGANPPSEPCHTVAWPDQPLPALGGRLRVAVRSTSQPCDWMAPHSESRWILVVPPSELSAPPRHLLSSNHPLAMPLYDPAANQLTIEFAANHTSRERVAVLRHGTREIRIRQQAGPKDCLVPPGPGFVSEGWRYTLSRRSYPYRAAYLKAVQRDETPLAAPVTWTMVYAMLVGNPDLGMQFAADVGIARHSWEEDLGASGCFNIWLSGDDPPRFINYFLNRRRLSYKEDDQVNNDQFDLGEFDHAGQVLYRVPVSPTAMAPAHREMIGPPDGPRSR